MSLCGIMTNEINYGRNEAMPQDNRLNLDGGDDFEILKGNLLKDVEEATKNAKQRQARDAALEAKGKAASKNKIIMFVVVAIAAIVIGYMAWKSTSAEPERAKIDVNSGGFKPMKANPAPQSTAPTRMPATGVPAAPANSGSAYRPTAPTPARPAAPASEPVRRNGTDTYDEGGGSRM